MKHFKFVFFIMVLFGWAGAAQADFVVTSAIVEFTKDKPPQQDIELISRSANNDYIVVEVNEVINPGTPNEMRRLITDPAKSRLLVTPDRTILTGGSRKTIRFVLLNELDDKEHIYRVAIKPVVKGVEHDTQLGLKILLGYEVLVILRPAEMKPEFQVSRNGNKIMLRNSGNTNVVLQNGQQCVSAGNCKMPPTLRSYAGQTAEAELPFNGTVSYSIWDGREIIEKKVD